MFVGHYGVSFAARRMDPTIPLWVLFLAVQFLDVLWAPFVLLGIEKVRIVSGITVSNPFSHWVLDLIVHRPDLPLYDDSAKVGLGLWDEPALALGLEAALLFGGMWLWLGRNLARSPGTIVLAILMLGIQVYVFFGPPAASDRAAASTALIAYAVFAAAIFWLHDRRTLRGG